MLKTNGKRSLISIQMILQSLQKYGTLPFYTQHMATIIMYTWEQMKECIDVVDMSKPSLEVKLNHLLAGFSHRQASLKTTS